MLTKTLKALNFDTCKLSIKFCHSLAHFLITDFCSISFSPFILFSYYLFHVRSPWHTYLSLLNYAPGLVTIFPLHGLCAQRAKHVNVFVFFKYDYKYEYITICGNFTWSWCTGIELTSYTHTRLCTWNGLSHTASITWDINKYTTRHPCLLYKNRLKMKSYWFHSAFIDGFLHFILHIKRTEDSVRKAQPHGSKRRRRCNVCLPWVRNGLSKHNRGDWCKYQTKDPLSVSPSSFTHLHHNLFDKRSCLREIF